MSSFVVFQINHSGFGAPEIVEGRMFRPGLCARSLSAVPSPAIRGAKVGDSTQDRQVT